MGFHRASLRSTALHTRSARAVGVGLLLVLASCSDSVSDTGTNPSSSAGAEAEAVGEGLTRPLSLTDPSTTPAVDRTRASVGLDTIVFDTFDGGSVPLSEADAETIARLFDAIPPIDAPGYSTAVEAGDWLDPTDVIVGYVDPADRAWAYPVRILNSHEIVNDELSGQPVLITYCPLCGSGAVFDRRLDGRLLSFSNTSALHENDLVMVDRESGSYWWQLAGRALVGELEGQSLTLLPGETTSWQSWSDRHPDTQVMERPAGRSYDRDPFVGIGASLDAGRTPFPVDPSVFADDRLPPSTRVVIVEIDGETRAFPTAPARTIDDTVAGHAVSITADGVGATVVGPDGSLPVRFSYWYAALAAFPEISVGP